MISQLNETDTTRSSIREIVVDELTILFNNETSEKEVNPAAAKNSRATSCSGKRQEYLKYITIEEAMKETPKEWMKSVGVQLLAFERIGTYVPAKKLPLGEKFLIAKWACRF